MRKKRESQETSPSQMTIAVVSIVHQSQIFGYFLLWKRKRKESIITKDKTILSTAVNRRSLQFSKKIKILPKKNKTAMYCLWKYNTKMSQYP